MTDMKVEVVMMNIRVLIMVAIMSSWIVSFAASSAQSARSTSGTITFYGAIVDSPCDTAFIDSTITTRCYRNGQTLTQRQTVSARMPLTARLPGNLASSRMEWLNPQRNLGILTVTYL
jgi:type 1 fimbria pilin